MRRILIVGMIVFVGVMAALAMLTQGEGTLFVASAVSAAAVLIAVVVLVVFSGTRRPVPDAAPGDFSGFEEAARYALRGGLVDRAGPGDPQGSPQDLEAIEVSRSSAHAFVKALVPLAVSPPALGSASTRREFLDALRREGTGLIRLAQVTGVDVTPYQAFLADARKAALRGDGSATLRSLQLANEMLRSTIEKFLVKRKTAGQGTVAGLDEFLGR
jgi:hypothetical protein